MRSVDFEPGEVSAWLRGTLRPTDGEPVARIDGLQPSMLLVDRSGQRFHLVAPTEEIARRLGEVGSSESVVLHGPVRTHPRLEGLVIELRGIETAGS